MNIDEIVSHVDHTLLAVEATSEQIKLLCKNAVRLGCASVCVAPCFTGLAKKEVRGEIKVCTVIGFPAGFQTTAVKVFEAKDAIKNGADEIDMVINIGFLKEKSYDDLIFEIEEVKKACKDKTLKVIIETCLLTQEEKIKMCEIVYKANADYIKTSTGFSNGGATFDDVRLFNSLLKNKVKIKAAGGIKTLGDAEEFLRLGADRLGTSKVVSLILKNESDTDY